MTFEVSYAVVFHAAYNLDFLWKSALQMSGSTKSGLYGCKGKTEKHA